MGKKPMSATDRAMARLKKNNPGAFPLVTKRVTVVEIDADGKPVKKKKRSYH